MNGRNSNLMGANVANAFALLRVVGPGLKRVAKVVVAEEHRQRRRLSFGLDLILTMIGSMTSTEAF
jgi:hypothetical protein